MPDDRSRAMAMLEEILERVKGIEAHLGIEAPLGVVIAEERAPAPAPPASEQRWGTENDAAILAFLDSRGADGALFRVIEGALGIPESPLMSALQRMRKSEGTIVYVPGRKKGKRSGSRWVHADHVDRPALVEALDSEFAAVTRA